MGKSEQNSFVRILQTRYQINYSQDNKLSAQFHETDVVFLNIDQFLENPFIEFLYWPLKN